MKHPKIEILQDYFENVLNPKHEELVKEHLLNCDECTRMLSDFARLETLVKKSPAPMVSVTMKNKIYLDSKKLLDVKKMKQMKKEEIKLNRVRLLDTLKEWEKIIFPSIKIPALQFASVSIIVLAIIYVEKMESIQEKTYYPISTEVHEYGYEDIKEEKK